MEKENILVTGGAGYIGSHIVRDLGEAGYNPVVVDNLSMGHREYVLCGEFIEGDAGDEELISKILKTYGIRSVIHFAAFMQVEESVHDPLKYYHNNSVNSFRLIRACVQNGVENFVFSSTAAVYGIPEHIPAVETSPLNPINPYGSSKFFTEMVLRDTAAANTGFNYVALRYFNVAGADKSVRIGQNYKKPTHLITLALRAALGEYPSLKIFGTDYDTRDGTAIRDYIHIDDLSKAHLLSLGFLKDKGGSRIFNCGYGRGSTVREVVSAVMRVTGIEFPLENSPRRAGDPPVLVADSSMIRRELGWVPDSDDLDLIIRNAWEWEKKLKSG
jgi:UDP-glucose 4-epimerase